MIDLHRGVLEEFVEAARYTNEDTFAVLSDHASRRTAQHRKDCATYRGKVRLDSVWRENERARQKDSRARLRSGK